VAFRWAWQAPRKKPRPLFHPYFSGIEIMSDFEDLKKKKKSTQQAIEISTKKPLRTNYVFAQTLKFKKIRKKDEVVAEKKKQNK